MSQPWTLRSRHNGSTCRGEEIWSIFLPPTFLNSLLLVFKVLTTSNLHSLRLPTSKHLPVSSNTFLYPQTYIDYVGTDTSKLDCDCVRKFLGILWCSVRSWRMFRTSVEEEIDVVKECISSGDREHGKQGCGDLEFLSFLEPGYCDREPLEIVLESWLNQFVLRNSHFSKELAAFILWRPIVDVLGSTDHCNYSSRPQCHMNTSMNNVTVSIYIYKNSQIQVPAVKARDIVLPSCGLAPISRPPCTTFPACRNIYSRSSTYIWEPNVWLSVCVLLH